MKKWNLLSESKFKDSKDLINILLENRGIKTKKEKDEFLNPSLSKVSVDSVGIDKKELLKTIKRIELAIKKKEQIIVFGDYDVDGICASAILWETLHKMGARILPYIPNRFDEGYGLSEIGTDNVLEKNPDTKVIITVDNGIVAEKAVEYASKKGIDVIVTDHHTAAKKLPKAYAILHTTALCGAGVAYMLSKSLIKEKIEKKDTHLELVCLATIADLVPLKGANRAFVSFGLKALWETKRFGLLELFKISTINPKDIGVFEIGHIIAPKLNAMGRLKSAMDSLRLICTTNSKRAKDLAAVLSNTNLERQQITGEILEHAKTNAKKNLKNLIFIADKSYQQGIIGLVAGRLVEEFYLPSIVISKGEIYSKASARSVSGFNIVEFLREASDLMVDIGGHPMAAGFTVETKRLDELKERLYQKALSQITPDHLEKILNIDIELPEEYIRPGVFAQLQKLAPFGMATPEPLFVTHDLRIQNIQSVGKDGKHLKLKLVTTNGIYLDAIAFGMGGKLENKIGDIVSVVYVLEVNEWNGNKRLQLEVKDIKTD